MDTINLRKILVAIPAHNEELIIVEVAKKIKTATEQDKKHTYSLVVFDDASKDNTAINLKKENFNVYEIKKSFGLGNVFTHITNYFLENNFDYLLTIDGDGQFDANDIEKIIEPILNNKADMVTGSRFLKESQTTNISWIKKFGNKIGAKYISSILREKYFDVTCGFRAYTKEAILKLHTFSDFTYTQEVFLNLGFKKIKIKEVPIKTMYFKNRKSRMVKSVFGYILKSFKIIIKSMLIYSPMRLFGRLSIISLLVSGIAGIFIFIWDKTHGEVTPFKWLAIVSLVSFLISIILYALGILLQITSRIQFTLEENLYYQKRQTYTQHGKS